MTQGFAPSVALRLAGGSEERKNVNGGNDIWFIAQSVAPKMKMMQ